MQMRYMKHQKQFSIFCQRGIEKFKTIDGIVWFPMIRIINPKFRKNRKDR